MLTNYKCCVNHFLMHMCLKNFFLDGSFTVAFNGSYGYSLLVK